MNPKSKSVLKSKTEWVNAIITAGTLIGYFYPPTTTWISSHAMEIVIGLGIANLALRLISHGRVTLFGSND